MPDVKKGESKNDYLSRCISSEEMKKEIPQKDKRIKVCYEYWEDKRGQE